MPGPASVVLLWLPLGAGGRCVRTNGRAYEAVVARWERRSPRDLYHSALEVTADGRRSVVEMTPVWGGPPGDRGVVREGPVGSPLLGRSRAFRYEVRRWPGGVVPDADEAVGGPHVCDVDATTARRLLARVPDFPAATWGRDEQRTGDMWNSNSLVSWLLTVAGLVDRLPGPPAGGRAPGWDAGRTVAQRMSALSP